MRARVSIDQEEMDRLVLMRMDVDRYEAQLIPDLHARVHELTQALELLLAAVADASGSNLLEAVARANRALQR
jgi:hypothetical protein